MSTKMSTDLNITRPTSRVIRPPGGASSNIFGSEPSVPPASKGGVANSPVTSKKAVVANSPAKPPAPPAAESVEIPATPKKPASSGGKVGIVVGGTVEVDFVVNAIAKALVVEGITGSVVSKVSDIAALPFAAQNVSRSVDVVIAAAIVANDLNGTISQALTSTLLQAGVSGRAPIIPGIVSQPSLLEAKALLPEMAKGWAQSANTILGLQFGGALELEAAPEPVIAPKPVYTPTEDNVSVLMDCFRESLKARGARGIAGLSRKFRIADDNGNGLIDLKEFTKVVSEHGFNWTAAQIKLLFDSFDHDKSGSITFDEFLVAVRGELNERRKSLVMLAFDLLDADKSGLIEVDDIRAKYNASKHPDVISGKRSADDVLAEFLDTFDSIDKDGKVTPAEFVKYYGNVSSSIDEDDYFELMIRNAWRISGGEGWCANTTCRRVLATHQDGHQTVQEIKNDLGMKDDDFEAMMANLKNQGLDDIIEIELANGKKSSSAHSPVAAAEVKDEPSATPAKNATAKFDPRPSSAQPQQFYGRRAPGGQSSIIFG